jgi:hypothetical protein
MSLNAGSSPAFLGITGFPGGFADSTIGGPPLLLDGINTGSPGVRQMERIEVGSTERR